MKSADIKKLVKTVAKQVDGLMVTVSHSTVASTDRYGKKTYNTAVSRSAAVFKKEERKTRSDGVEVATHTQIIFPAPVTVTVEDRVKWATDGLGAGESWPIIAIDSPLDSDGNPYITQVWLGYRTQ